MTLEELGYDQTFEAFRTEHNIEISEVGRVITEHKERYIVRTESGSYESEILGNMRYAAENRHDFPAVGDWVAISVYDSNQAVIHKIFPRRSIIERQEVGKFGEKQIIAVNIDVCLIMQAVDRDFNINRLERYITISNAANTQPIIILNKIDLIDDTELNKILKSIKDRIDNIAIIPVSNETKTGFEKLIALTEKGKTYCILGSSGVGKSTLINNLSGKDLMKTNTISQSTKRGRHITTHRELTVLENGGILIDNPGMREIGITDTSGATDQTFFSIVQLSEKCLYKDCTHIHEKDCAVIDAVRSGKLEQSSYENYLKIQREEEYFRMDYNEKRQKDKAFGKQLKNWKKDFKKYKG